MKKAAKVEAEIAAKCRAYAIDSTNDFFSRHPDLLPGNGEWKSVYNIFLYTARDLFDKSQAHP